MTTAEKCFHAMVSFEPHDILVLVKNLGEIVPMVNNIAEAVRPQRLESVRTTPPGMVKFTNGTIVRVVSIGGPNARDSLRGICTDVIFQTTYFKSKYDEETMLALMTSTRDCAIIWGKLF